ncbi:hypothetical protein CVS40_3395 [Lucilia cuprina]|nr:hypothetical protein CVS40_3395 [Lucilia cuprina]
MTPDLFACCFRDRYHLVSCTSTWAFNPDMSPIHKSYYSRKIELFMNSKFCVLFLCLSHFQAAKEVISHWPLVTTSG